MIIFAHYRWMGAFLYLMTLAGVSGQTASTPPQPISSATVTLQAYQQEQMALAQEEQTLIANGAMQQQVVSWHQQNAARFAAQQQRASALAAAVAQPVPTNHQPVIPPNASPTLAAYLTTQAALANAQAQIQNQNLQQTSVVGQSISSAQTSQSQQATQTFQQQHVADFQLQAQRAQTLAQASAPTVLLAPPPLRIPPNASPELQAFLTAQNQQLRARMQQAQNSSSPATPPQN